MSTYSSNLKIELIGTGEQSGDWGTTTNENFVNVFEDAIVGRVIVNFPTDADLTLTYTDTVVTQAARHLYLNVTSTGSQTATRSLIVPTINKTYIIENNTTGGQAILVKTVAGTGITVPNGKKAPVYVNGADVVVAWDYLGGNLGVSGDLAVAGAASFAGNSAFNSTGYVLISSGTTAQRPVSPVNGYMRYNTDTNQFEGYQGGAWGQLGGGATGGGGDEVFVENGVTVTTNYTLSTNKNAESVGPITVNSGISVTVPSGSRWVVL